MSGTSLLVPDGAGGFDRQRFVTELLHHRAALAHARAQGGQAELSPEAIQQLVELKRLAQQPRPPGAELEDGGGLTSRSRRAGDAANDSAEAGIDSSMAQLSRAQQEILDRIRQKANNADDLEGCSDQGEERLHSNDNSTFKKRIQNMKFFGQDHGAGLPETVVKLGGALEHSADAVTDLNIDSALLPGHLANEYANQLAAMGGLPFDDLEATRLDAGDSPRGKPSLSPALDRRGGVETVAHLTKRQDDSRLDIAVGVVEKSTGKTGLHKRPKEEEKHAEALATGGNDEAYEQSRRSRFLDQSLEDGAPSEGGHGGGLGSIMGGVGTMEDEQEELGRGLRHSFSVAQT